MCIYHTSFILTLIQKRKSSIKMTIVWCVCDNNNKYIALGPQRHIVPVSVSFLFSFEIFCPMFWWTCSMFTAHVYCCLFIHMPHRIIIFFEIMFCTSVYVFSFSLSWNCAHSCRYCVSSAIHRGTSPLRRISSALSTLQIVIYSQHFMLAVSYVRYFCTNIEHFTSFWYFLCACHE